MIKPLDNRFKFFFFFSFASLGILSPFLGLYLTHKGLSGAQLGLLLGLIPLVQIMVQPLWGYVADKYQIRKQILSFSLVALAASSFLFVFLNGFELILVAVILYAALGAPFIPIVNALTLDFLSKSEKQGEFGSFRLWGSAGFIVFSLLSGTLLVKTRINLLPYFYAGTLFFSGWIAWGLPDEKPRANRKRVNLIDGMKILPAHPNLVVFFVGMAFTGAVLAIVNQYLSIHVSELNATGWILGGVTSVQALLEIPLMSQTQKIVRRLGIRKAILIGVAVLPLRFFLYILIKNPFWLLFVQLLHGLSILSMTVVGPMYVSEKLAPEWRATGQSLYTTAYGGIGSSLGLFIAGFLHGWQGMQSVWIFCILVSLTSFWILSRVDFFAPDLNESETIKAV